MHLLARTLRNGEIDLARSAIGPRSASSSANDHYSGNLSLTLCASVLVRFVRL